MVTTKRPNEQPCEPWASLLVEPYIPKVSDAGDISPPFFWISRQILGNFKPNLGQNLGNFAILGQIFRHFLAKIAITATSLRF